MIADLKKIPLEYGEFGEMPMYLKVPVTHRVRRFQLGKLKIILKELQDEEEAALKDKEEVSEANSPTTLPLLPTTTMPTEDLLEVGSTAD
eukprot:5824841-Amphidinium_carterae.1